MGDAVSWGNGLAVHRYTLRLLTSNTLRNLSRSLLQTGHLDRTPREELQSYKGIIDHTALEDVNLGRGRVAVVFIAYRKFKFKLLSHCVTGGSIL